MSYKIESVLRATAELRPSPRPYTVSYSFIAENKQTVNRFIVDDTNRIRQFATFNEAREVALDFVADDACPDGCFTHVNKSARRFETGESVVETYGPFVDGLSTERAVDLIHAGMAPIYVNDPRAEMRDAAERFDRFMQERKDGYASGGFVRSATFRKPNAKAADAFERFVADVFGEPIGSKPGA